MKKVLTVLLILALALSLAACGDNTAAASENGAADGLTAGTYTGEAEGYGGALKVDVTVGEDGKITAVTPAADNGETPGIGGAAMEELAPKVVEANGTDGVEAVSNATVTSEAFLEAVNKALDQAK